jgi:hypothetical protein
VKEPGERLGYIYNLGLFWAHTITVEALLPPPARAAVPQVMLEPTAATLMELPRPLLLGGAMHCPPDLPSPNELAPGGGGNAAYQAMLDAMLDESHQDHNQVRREGAYCRKIT